MDIPIKFIYGWLIVIIVTYAVAGYIYSTEYSSITYDAPDEDIDLSIFDVVANAIIWFGNAMISIFKVFFFVLPEMPWQVTTVMNLIFVPTNIVWFLGIYPFLKDFGHLILESGKTVAEWLDAIIPF